MDPAVFYMVALVATILTIFSFVKPLYGLLAGVIWLMLAVSTNYVSIPAVVNGELRWVSNPNNWIASYLFAGVGIATLLTSFFRTVKEVVNWIRERKEVEMV